MQRRILTDYLSDFLRRGAETAFMHRRGYRTVRWSYRDVAVTAAQFGRELEARGINKGERVALWGQNCAEWVAALFGCALRGAVVLPMDLIAAPDFAARAFRETNVKLVVCSRNLMAKAAGFPTMLLDNLRESVARHCRSQYSPAAADSAEPVQIVFTSGTTAEPKGVVISHRNILANLEPLESEIKKYLRYERLVHPIRFLNLLPLSHVFGQFMGIFVPQLLGAVVVFQESLNPAEVIRTIRKERVSVLVAVPRLLQSLREKLERDHENSGRGEWFREQLRAAEGESFLKHWWRFRQIHRQLGWKFWAVISGGSALDAETETFWDRIGVAVIQGYGMTETTSLITVSHPFKLERRSIGKVLAGRELKLDENGEILVRGDSLAQSYWQGGRLEPVAAAGDWFRTGDLGELDEAGNLYFKGRRKNVIVTAEGLNIYPEDLEDVLRRQPEIRDCTVIALEREGNAEPCAVLILRGTDADPARAVQRANASLARFQRIRRWVVWPEQDFPRTSTQKPRIAEIQRKLQDLLACKTASPSQTALAQLVQQITRRRLTGNARDSMSAASLDLSSIERVELLGALEENYQVEIDESKFTATTTLRDLEEVLRAPATRPAEYHCPRWAQRWPVTWIRPLVYYLLVWPATVLLGCPRVRGRANLDNLRGPVLVIANHVTSIDIGFILKALPVRLRHTLAVAMDGERLESMRRPPAARFFLLRWIDRLSYLLALSLFNVFPLPQLAGFRESFRFAGEAADRGFSILVFPEGLRTRDGRLAPFRQGIALLAANLDLSVLPMRISGLFELKWAGKRVARPGAITVTIGPAVRVDPGADPSAITRTLERCVAELSEHA